MKYIYPGWFNACSYLVLLSFFFTNAQDEREIFSTGCANRSRELDEMDSDRFVFFGRFFYSHSLDGRVNRSRELSFSSHSIFLGARK